jgi:hypothetical protein
MLHLGQCHKKMAIFSFSFVFKLWFIKALVYLMAKCSIKGIIFFFFFSNRFKAKASTQIPFHLGVGIRSEIVELSTSTETNPPGPKERAKREYPNLKDLVQHFFSNRTKWTYTKLSASAQEILRPKATI